MQHEGRAGKWKRVQLFQENWPMRRKRTFLKNHKSTMENGDMALLNETWRQKLEREGRLYEQE